jgi:simple sugar transport system permease protein
MKRFWPLLLALIIALAVCALAVAAAGQSPLVAARALIDGAVGSRERWAESLAKTIPLLFTGLGVLLAFRAGFFNIGAEGQFLVGALAASAVATRTDAIWPLVLISGAIAGSLWALIAGFLKTARGAPEIITTIMLNYIALALVQFAVSGPLQERARTQPQTDVFPPKAQLPALIDGTNCHIGLLIAIVCTGACWWLLFRTQSGFTMRAVGFNPLAARAMKVQTSTRTLQAVALAGALSGVAGAAEMAGATRQMGMGGFGYGYTAIAVALLAGLNPLWAIPSALLFGMLSAGGGAMERSADVPAVTSYIVVGVLVFFAAVAQRLKTEKKP